MKQSSGKAGELIQEIEARYDTDYQIGQDNIEGQGCDMHSHEFSRAAFSPFCSWSGPPGPG